MKPEPKTDKMSQSKSIAELPYDEAHLRFFLKCCDHTVSRETFELYEDPRTGMLVTLPRPSEEELPKYYESDAYISHTDSKTGWMEHIYHVVRDHAIRKKVQMVLSWNGSWGRILDVGCGTGDFLAACDRDGWQAYGVEPNEKARKNALAKIGNSEAIAASLAELKKGSSSPFDVITLWHVLEHVPDLSEYIATIGSLLSETGSLVVAVPNFESYDAKHYKEHWAAYDVPRHLWHFNQKAMQKLFEIHGFRLEAIQPMYFDSFYVSLLSEKYKTGRPRIFRAFFYGALSNWKARRTNQYSSLIYLLKKR